MTQTPRQTVVQIGKYYPPVIGGIENNVQQVARAADTDFDSVVVCMRKGAGPRQATQDGAVRVIHLASKGAVWRQEIVESPVALLTELQPDLLHFHTPNPLLAFPIRRFLKAHPGIKVVVSHHSDLQRPEPLRSLANIATRALLDRADAVISYTQIFADHAQELIPHMGKLTIIPHGSPLPDRAVQPGPRSAPDHLPMLRLGFLGRIERWKGLDVVAEAMQSDPQIHLTVAGDGGYRQELQNNMAAKLPADRVTFLGKVLGPDKEAFFDQIDALVLPSLNTGESYGQVVIEAQLRGLPVIASDLPTGLRELCAHTKTGLMFTPGDATALLAQVAQLRDPACYNGLAARGHHQALTRFSEPAVADKITALYQGLLSGQ